MMLGNIQRFEIVVRRFDFGAFDHAEANRGENALQFFVGLADQVARADGALDAGKRKVDFFTGWRCCVLQPLLFRRVFADIRASMWALSALRLCPTTGLISLDADLSQFSVISDTSPDFRPSPLYARDAQISMESMS